MHAGASCAKPTYVARYGGDEFVVLLPETPCSGASGVADAHTPANRIRQHSQRARQPVHTTVSIGVASYPDHGNNLEMIMEKADLAMYTSKAEGKNRTTVYGEQ